MPAVSQAVLRSYPGVEGGYYVRSQFLGYSFPTHDNPAAKTDVPSAERSVIQEATERAVLNGKADQLLRGGNELVLIQAASVPQRDAVVWTMERRSREPTGTGRRVLLVALVVAALLSVGGTLQMGIALRRGVSRIQDGLSSLEKDFAHRLSEGSDELGEEDLLPVIRKCVQVVQPEETTKKISIHASPENPALRARIDSQRLTQALMNLLLNAVEATPHGGDVSVNLRQADQTVAIEVHDSGPGLSEEQQKYLFEAFYTTKPDGTGLGLAVSRELVEEMGGKLTYKNNSPGATFIVELPAVRNA